MWRFFFYGWLAAILATLASSARAASPEVDTLQAVATNGSVAVRLTLKNAFEQADITRSLQSGLPTGFTYHVELVRKRPNWFDDTLAVSTIEVIATYNSVTREYLINYRRDGKLVRSETTTELSQLRERMTKLDEPSLFERHGRPASKLVVRARADISRKVVFYIIPSLVSTDWKQTRVRTAGKARSER